MTARTRFRRTGERKLLLRSRIALTTACIVATTIAGISVVTWFATRHNLRSQIDQTLVDKPPPQVIRLPDDPSRQPATPNLDFLCDHSEPAQALRRYVEGLQLLRADGSTCAPAGVDPVRTIEQDRTATAVTLRDGETVSGKPVRVAVRPLGNGEVFITSRDVTGLNETLSGLANVLIVMCLLGMFAAAAAGRWQARRSLAPIERLTGTAEHIARTEDLETTVDVAGRDEAGRLGRAFTAMTVALRDSRRRQHQLVTDAAHELRTPLTSLRTNVDLLVRSEQTGRAIPGDRRAKILDRLQVQAGEFSDLVGELVELAREGTELAREEVPMRPVIDRAVRRAGSRAPDHVFDVRAADWSVTGDATALERVVLNLLDNAVKFAPTSSVITVRSGPHWLSVADQGPGIPADQRAHVFERFWRAPEARSLPGSGLGLSIVANTVAAHGGSVRFTDPPDGRGACVRIELPAAD